MSSYLITGGCGFIGSHLAEALLLAGHQVTILDNLSSGFISNIEPFRNRLVFIQEDVRNLEALKSAFTGKDGIFHQAALVSVFDSINRPQDNHDINITGTFNVLDAARQAGVKRVVLASSAAVYGNDPQLPKTESMKPCPESPYALGKLTGEYYAQLFAKLFNVQTVCLRYFNVYGPRQDPSSMYSGVISKFMDCFAVKKQVTIYGDGAQTRDFVFVNDVVRANVLAMTSSSVGKGESFNVASGRSVSLLDLHRLLQRLYESQLEPDFKEVRSGDIKFSSASIELIQQKIDYKPEIDLEKGLKLYREYL